MRHPRRLRGEPLEDRTAPAAGQLDPTFGTAGRVTEPFDSAGFRAADAVVQSDGKIVLVGSADGPGVRLLRLEADGKSLDPSFDGDGRAVLPIAAGRPAAVAVDALGRIVVVGGGASGAFVARLTPAGVLDPSFNPTGPQPGVLDGFPAGPAADVAVRPGGGYVVLAGGESASDPEFVIVAVTPGGAVDPAFGGGTGQAVLDFAAGGTPESPVGVAVGPGSPGGAEAITVVGTIDDTPADKRVGVGRLTAAGDPDPAFGTGGRVEFEVPLGEFADFRYTEAGGVAVDAAGRAVVAGVSVGYDVGRATLTGVVVARLTPAGAFDPAFAGGSGKGLYTITNATVGPPGDVLIDRAGRVVVTAGARASGQPSTDVAVLRLTPDGLRDAEFSVARVGFPAAAGATVRDVPAAVGLQSVGGADRIIVAAAHTINPGAAGASDEAGVARLETGDAPPPPPPPPLNPTPTPRPIPPIDLPELPRSPTLDPISPRFAVGAVGPAGDRVKVYGGTGFRDLLFTIDPYPGFRGPVYTALADFNADGFLDVITVPGPGGGPHVKVYDGKNTILPPNAVERVPNLLSGFLAFGGSSEADYRGGLRVAAGDVTGDGVPDVVVSRAPGGGGGPQVRVIDGSRLVEVAGHDADPAAVATFFAYAEGFRGGVSVAVGDIDGDGRADVVTGAGAGGAPHVRVFSGNGLGELRGLFAYQDGFRDGVEVAAGDLDGDGVAELVTAPGPGGGPDVRVFGTAGGGFPILAAAMVGDPAGRTGLSVAVRDVNGDGRGDVLASPVAGPAAGVAVFDGAALADRSGPVLDGPFVAPRTELYVNGQTGPARPSGSSSGTLEGVNTRLTFQYDLDFLAEDPGTGPPRLDPAASAATVSLSGTTHPAVVEDVGAAGALRVRLRGTDLLLPGIGAGLRIDLLARLVFASGVRHTVATLSYNPSTNQDEPPTVTVTSSHPALAALRPLPERQRLEPFAAGFAGGIVVG